MLYKHTVSVFDGSNNARSDRELIAKLCNYPNLSSPGVIASVGSIVAGSYTGMVTLSTSGNGSGAVLVPSMKALTAAVQTAQSGSGSYAPADTITLAGGTFTTASIITVTTTKVASATVAAGGSGGTNGTQTVTGTTGTGTKFQATVTVSGGAITAVQSIAIAGSYTANPSSLTAEPVTGAGLTGAQLNIKMGVDTFTISTAGSYTVLPSNPVAQGSTSGTGTGATFNINTWGLASVAVSSGGSNYDSGSALVVTGAGTGGASGTFTITNAGNAATIPIAAFKNLPTDANGVGTYGVIVNPGQDCRWYVTKSSKNQSGFNIVLAPKDGSTAIAPGFIDVYLYA